MWLRVKVGLGVVALLGSIAVTVSTQAVEDKPAELPTKETMGKFLSADTRDFFSILGSLATLQEGREIFRHDTFGSEAFWTDALELDQAILGEEQGGVGPGLDPQTALGLGLKVDLAKLPPSLQQAIAAGQVDLTDPAVTVALLRLDAVVGVKGSFAPNNGPMTQVGITCALCHSTVDDSFAPGIGQRLDGWANRDLDPGKIIALAPNLDPFVELLKIVHADIDEATVRTVLRSWGPGKFDASLLLDGKAFAPNGKPGAVLIPPAFGLAGINLHTWTGWGGVAHWNALVATLEMGGQGTLIDSRLDNERQFPIAAAAGFGHTRSDPDLVTSKLPALHLYQLSLEAPEPPPGSFDAVAAQRGKELFNGKADCASCHVPPIFTEPGYNLHKGREIGINGFQARRSPERGYRTAPLKGLWTHTKGGFYHDGRFLTLTEVVRHYDRTFDLELTEAETADLVEYLKSL